MKTRSILAVALTLSFTGTAFAAGPEETVAALAAAVANKDGKAFMRHIDLDAMLDAEPAMYGSDALYSGSSTRDKHYLEDAIASGVLALECKEARKPGCAWTTDGLKKPLVKSTGRNSAIAAVDNPEGIRTWIALRQGREGWKVVGVATRERHAETYASEPFQQKREDYRTKRIAAENAVAKRKAESARDAERKREARRAQAISAMQADRAILRTVTLSGMTVTRRTDTGYDGKQHTLRIRGTAVNGYSRDVERVRWRLDFVDENGESIAHTTWKDTDMNDKTLRKGVKYPRTWNVSLRTTALIKAGEKFAQGRCTVTIRPDMLYVGETFVTDQHRGY